jgi:hypothetical protein
VWEMSVTCCCSQGIAMNHLHDSNLIACILVNAISVDLLKDNIHLARIDRDAALLLQCSNEG